MPECFLSSDELILRARFKKCKKVKVPGMKKTGKIPLLQNLEAGKEDSITKCQNGTKLEKYVQGTSSQTL